MAPKFNVMIFTFCNFQNLLHINNDNSPYCKRPFTFVNIQQDNIHINNKKGKSAPLQLSMLLFFIIKKKKMIYILQLKDHMTSQVG